LNGCLGRSSTTTHLTTLPFAPLHLRLYMADTFILHHYICII
jgi:hypothetical protein